MEKRYNLQIDIQEKRNLIRTMNKGKNSISAVVVLIILFAIGIFITVSIFTKKKNSRFKISDTIINMPEKDKIEQAIEMYLENKHKENSYYSTSESKLFCAANISWQKDISDKEKLVYAQNNCANVVVINGDLRGVSGGGDFPSFKVQRTGNGWTVIDADSRAISPAEPITQNWVRDTEKLVPNNIKTGCFATNCFSTKGVIEKAAKYYKIELPRYSFNPCKKDSDCDSDSICVISGVHSNPGPNTCVKKCSANKDCGVAHTCIGQCVRGENGCPFTAQNICVPDLYHYELEKDPNGIIR